MKKNAIIFISCGIFQAELEHLRQVTGRNWNIVYLDAALHVNFDKLKAALTAALEQNRQAGAELKVIYGHCHPKIMDILQQYQARKIQAKNCLEALVGPRQIKRLNELGKAFFLSAGWVNNWEKIFALGEKDFDYDFKTMFGDYQRIVVLDSGVIPIDEEKVQRFSRYTNLPVHREPISLDYLLSLIERL